MDKNIPLQDLVKQNASIREQLINTFTEVIDSGRYVSGPGVENFENDEQLSFAELLTHAGFIVRTKAELIPCSVCRSAIPSETIYNKMKEHNMKFNFQWSNKCRNC